MCVKLLFVCILIEFVLCKVVNINEYSDDTYNDNVDNDVDFQLANERSYGLYQTSTPEQSYGLYKVNKTESSYGLYQTSTLEPLTCEREDGVRRCEAKCRNILFFLHGECIYPGYDLLYCRCVMFRVN